MVSKARQRYAEDLVSNILKDTANREYWKRTPQSAVTLALALLNAGHSDKQIIAMLQNFYYSVISECENSSCQ